MKTSDQVDFIKKIASTLEQEGERELALNFLLFSSRAVQQNSEEFDAVSEKDIRKARTEILQEARNRVISHHSKVQLTIIYCLLCFAVIASIINIIALNFSNPNEKANQTVNYNQNNDNIQNIKNKVDEIDGKIASLSNNIGLSMKDIMDVLVNSKESYTVNILQSVGRGDFKNASLYLQKISEINNVGQLEEVINSFQNVTYLEAQQMQCPEGVNKNLWELALHGKLIEHLKKIGLEPTFENLALAIQTNNKEAIELMLAYGLDINAIVDGVTLLSVASKYGDVDSIKLLLSYGADPGVKFDDGKTAIDFATDDTVKQLLSEQIKK